MNNTGKRLEKSRSYETAGPGPVLEDGRFAACVQSVIAESGKFDLDY